MFNECFCCGNSFGYDALEKKHLHRVGRYLVCNICLAELNGALGIELSESSVEHNNKFNKSGCQ